MLLWIVCSTLHNFTTSTFWLIDDLFWWYADASAISMIITMIIDTMMYAVVLTTSNASDNVLTQLIIEYN